MQKEEGKGGMRSKRKLTKAEKVAKIIFTLAFVKEIIQYQHSVPPYLIYSGLLL